MSLEKAKAFLEHVGRSPDLQKEVKEPGRKALQSVLGIAKKHGFECTGSELHNALRQKLGATKIPVAKNDVEANCILVLAQRPKH